MTRYRARRDSWAVWTLSAVAGVSLAAVFVVLDSSWGGWAKLLLGATLVGAGLFVLLLLVHTHYELENGQLIVRHGVLRWTIPVKDIRAVSPVRSLASSAALSRDRLQISYGRGYDAIEIAPRDADALVSALRQIAPEIEVRGIAT